jgi:thiol-disulfide isomerase/thioredoxin
MLDHPALAEPLRDDELWSSFMVFGWYVHPKEMRGLEPGLIALSEHVPERAPMLSVLGLLNMFNIVADADPTGYERREPLRLATIGALERLALYVDPDDPTLQRWNFARDIPGYIGNQITRLEGPAIRGTLIGGPAPELDFIWASGGRKLASLEELRGKVVVLDFWATWCGPCIASFPKTRELAARYRGYPVEIIGVTSLQGAHYEFGESIDCTDDPEKEMELMAEYVKGRDITWTVAFASQHVYNPEYNVDGIPRVVIIDAKGRVRDADLHPHNDHEREMELIDGLLREAGVEPPPPVEHDAAGE